MTDTSGWAHRKEVSLERVEKDLAFYKAKRKWARNWSHGLGLIIMVGSIVAPVAVSVGPGPVTISTVTVPSEVMKAIPIFITLVVAIAEGVRRIFQFQTRWVSTGVTHQLITRALDDYADATAGMEIGSEPWVAEFLKFKKYVNDAKSKETEEYFSNIAEMENKEKDKPARPAGN
ncbi:DUF4231 domain-containing protein [Rhizobium leguminosarum]|uniref:DUF4231 domain-containing protein n=1 Tax=Rhizobium leguminosarum TaxID=384 RepID=UPI001C98314A|nr:DUF4231 domain-containing protein [Rhizobium leguminosarum]MBY5698413.1 DUF4231 domain-containing protein [Rhizobium leguminosarum]